MAKAEIPFGLPGSDETLKLYLEQVAAGVPEDKRIPLNDDQQKAVDAMNWLDSQAAQQQATSKTDVGQIGPSLASIISAMED